MTPRHHPLDFRERERSTFYLRHRLDYGYVKISLFQRLALPDLITKSFMRCPLVLSVFGKTSLVLDIFLDIPSTYWPWWNPACPRGSCCFLPLFFIGTTVLTYPAMPLGLASWLTPSFYPRLLPLQSPVFHQQLGLQHARPTCI